MDQKDVTIYRLLNRNGRAKLVEIARELNFSHPSTKERLEKLLRNEDITVKALLNLRKKMWKVAVCNIKADSMEAAANLVNIFKKCPRVIFLQTLTGSYNLILIAIAKNTTILQYFIETEVRPREGVEKLDISFGDAPSVPEFLDLRIPKEKEEKPPCGVNDCITCYLYQQDCEGCPATHYFTRVELL